MFLCLHAFPGIRQLSIARALWYSRCCLHSLLPDPLIVVSSRWLQVHTTLTAFDIDDQDPPIGAEGETALLAALQVRNT
jgi:hypothetical protein